MLFFTKIRCLQKYYFLYIVNMIFEKNIKYVMLVNDRMDWYYEIISLKLKLFK